MALSFQRQGIFGRRNPMPDYRSPWETPGFGDSIIDRQAGIEPVNATPDAMPIGVKEITKKPGFFGQGGAGRAIAGTIGDFLLQQSGMDPIYLPNVLQQRDFEERARMAQQQRMQKREDFLFEENYKRQNPSTPNNDTVADYNFWKQTLPPEQFQKWLQNKIDPPQYRQGPDGNFYRINEPQGPLPTFTEDDWNNAGGSVGNGAGGFR